MATQVYSAFDVSQSDKVASFDSTSHVVIWSNLAAGDDGAPLLMPVSADRSIHFLGTFSGATVLFEGSNEGTDYETLNDPFVMAPISLAAKGIRQVGELTLYVRPRVVGGDVNTLITAALLLKRRY